MLEIMCVFERVSEEIFDYSARFCISSRTRSVISRAHARFPGGGARGFRAFSQISPISSYTSGASSLAHVLIGNMSRARPAPKRPHRLISSFNLKKKIGFVLLRSVCQLKNIFFIFWVSKVNK